MMNILILFVPIGVCVLLHIFSNYVRVVEHVISSFKLRWELEHM